jgi:hypothetical protein
MLFGEPLEAGTFAAKEESPVACQEALEAQ